MGCCEPLLLRSSVLQVPHTTGSDNHTLLIFNSCHTPAIFAIVAVSSRGHHIVPLHLQLALSNALRYFPAEVHAELAPEFLQELHVCHRLPAWSSIPACTQADSVLTDPRFQSCCSYHLRSSKCYCFPCLCYTFPNSCLESCRQRYAICVVVTCRITATFTCTASCP